MTIGIREARRPYSHESVEVGVLTTHVVAASEMRADDLDQQLKLAESEGLFVGNLSSESPLLAVDFKMPSATASPPTSISFRVISHNIRYASRPRERFNKEEPWETRLPLLVQQWRYHIRHTPSTFICLQEVLAHQLSDILCGLNEGESGVPWTYTGCGRDDGKLKGEMSPIIFKSTDWEFINGMTIWLSPTPNKPSKGWDAASPRIATFGLFQHTKTGFKIIGASTHLDDQGPISRRESAKLLVRKLSEGYESENALQRPRFLAGDLNSTTDGEAYMILNALDSPIRDISELCGWTDVYGHTNTFTGFDGAGDGEGQQRLDFIFCNVNRLPMTGCDGYAVLPNKFDDAENVYLSDHRAVVGDLTVYLEEPPMGWVGSLCS